MNSRKKSPSLVRNAWGLGSSGGLVVVPDELAAFATRSRLSPAERLTLFGLVRGWNPRTSPRPVVAVSLDALSLWSGVSRGRQSETLRELADGFAPPLLEILGPGLRGAARPISLVRLVALVAAGGTARRVPPAERNASAKGSAGRTDSFGGRNQTVPPAEPNRSAGRTQSSLETPQTLEKGRQETDAGGSRDDVAGLSDAEIRAAMLGRIPALRDAAAAEWALRKQRPKRETTNASG